MTWGTTSNMEAFPSIFDTSARDQRLSVCGCASAASHRRLLAKNWYASAGGEFRRSATYVSESLQMFRGSPEHVLTEFPIAKKMDSSSLSFPIMR
jgi:hypothetical protein